MCRNLLISHMHWANWIAFCANWILFRKLLPVLVSRNMFPVVLCKRIRVSSHTLKSFYQFSIDVCVGGGLFFMCVSSFFPNLLLQALVFLQYMLLTAVPKVVGCSCCHLTGTVTVSSKVHPIFLSGQLLPDGGDMVRLVGPLWHFSGCEASSSVRSNTE